MARGARPRPGGAAARSRSTSPTRRSSRPTSTCCTTGLEDEGVDFWWLDWQQGPHSRIAGIDPLWMLNHFHFLDSGARRPPPADVLPVRRAPAATATRSGSPATRSSAGRRSTFQPEFTATASNIGYGWWSHDIGGHLWGVRDDELATRWVQLGVWSPILRLHSSNNPFLDEGAVDVPGGDPRGHRRRRSASGVRLVPYLHSMNHRAADEGVPLVAAAVPRVRPTSRPPTRPRTSSRSAASSSSRRSRRPRDPVTLHGSRDRVAAARHLGRHRTPASSTRAAAPMRLHRDARDDPRAARTAGGDPAARRGATRPDATRNPAHLEVLVALGADGAFALVEDDGTRRRHRRGRRCPATRRAAP